MTVKTAELLLDGQLLARHLLGLPDGTRIVGAKWDETGHVRLTITNPDLPVPENAGVLDDIPIVTPRYEEITGCAGARIARFTGWM